MASIHLHRLPRSLIILSALLVPQVSNALPPFTPVDFRYSVYSDTAAELFWNRTTNVSMQGYESTRNGEYLGVFDTLSYFDARLSPGVEYTYTVAATGTNGERSGVSTVSLRTPPYADTIASLQQTIASLAEEIDSLKSQLADAIRSAVTQTGQKLSIRPGDDSDWQASLAWPDPRFRVNVNLEDDLNTTG